MKSNGVLWGLQIVVGLYFVVIGVLHFVVPDGLPEPLSWMYELSDGLHIVSGTAEVLGGLGLILPGLTKIRPELTTYAAGGLALVMIGAAVWHVTRSEFSNIGFNLVLTALVAWIGYARWRHTPLVPAD